MTSGTPSMTDGKKMVELVRRLSDLADLHKRNARLSAPPFTGNRAVLETAKAQAQ